MFCTGIESSNPTIDHGRTRRNEMESCRFYERWKEDFALVQDLRINFLRYGPPIHRTWLGPDRHDWDFADQTFAELRRRRIVLPTQSLCLTVPVVMPGEGGDVHAEAQRDKAREIVASETAQPATQAS